MALASTHNCSAHPDDCPPARETQGEACGRYPASPAQKRSWFLSRLHVDSSAFNVCRVFRVQGELDVLRLEQCLGVLLQRHQILRASFSVEGDQLVQDVQTGVRVPVRVTEGDLPTGKDSSTLAMEWACRLASLPMDVNDCPLVRCEVYRLSGFQWLLTVVCHRVVADERSLDLLVEELAALYGPRPDCDSSREPQNGPQYVEFAQRQSAGLQSGPLKGELDSCLRQLCPPLPALQMPLDRPRPAVQSLEGGARRSVVPSDFTTAFAAFCQEQQVDVAAGWLAAFCVLLHRYTAQEEVVCGIRVDGRHRAATRRMVGPLEGLCVLRATLARNPGFREFLGTVARGLIGAQMFQDVPFEAVWELASPSRNVGTLPLCQAVYGYSASSVRPPLLAGTALVPVELPVVACLGELSLNVAASESGTVLQMDYNRELFLPGTIDRMLFQLEMLARGMVAHPESGIQNVPLLTEAERLQVLVSQNDTTREYPREKCIHHLFQESAERTPEAIAVECNGQQLTYRELSAQSDVLAARLCAAGVGPETIVPLCVERSLELVIGILGILKAGGAYLPLDPTYPKERLWLMLEDCQAPVIVTQAHLGGIVAGQRAALICLEPRRGPLASEMPQAPSVRVTPDNLAYVIYTSGSTGRPKGVLVTHRNVVHSTCARFLTYPQKVESFLMLYSHAFDSSVAGIFWTLSQGGKLVLPLVGEERNPGELARTLARVRASHLDCLPSLYRLVLECGKAEDLSSLKVVIVGGEACPPGLPAEHRNKLPHTKLYNEYGPTECTVWATVYPLETTSDMASVPIGRPIANMQAYILDAHLQPVPPGIPGELYLGGDGVARGYLNQPDQTEARFVPNPFDPKRSARLYRTGDRARYLADANIEYLGRTDRQVKMRGFRIEVGEIEAALQTHPAVAESAVVAREDAPGAKRLVAYVLGRSDSSTAELRAFLKARLPEHMVPSAFVHLSSMPRTPNGKVDLQALPAPSPLRGDVGLEFSRPTSPLQSQLVELWERMLGVQPIGIRSNFFELGGDSLLAVRLYLEIERQFGKTLPLVTFLQAPTIERLAEVMERGAEQQAWSSLVAIQPEGSRPPIYLVAGTGGNVIGYEALARHLGPDQPVYGFQSWGLGAGRAPHTRVEEMAAHYIAELRHLQPQGPYFLGGLSFGGMVAYEMAQQLHAAGQSVGLVALFDTDYMGKLEQLGAWESFIRLLYLTKQRVDIHANHIRRLRPSDVQPYLHGKLLILKRRLRNRLWERAHAYHTANSTSLSKFLQNVSEANHSAARRYQPRVYPGRVTLFRAGTPEMDAPKWHPWAAWKYLAAGGLVVSYVPGDHLGMLLEPHVKVLAEKVGDAIAERLV